MIKTAVKKLLDDLKDEKEIISLSTKYGVLHKRTAFVAVGPMLKDPASGDVKLEKVSITRSSPHSGYFGFSSGPPYGGRMTAYCVAPNSYSCDSDDDDDEEEEEDMDSYGSMSQDHDFESVPFVSRKASRREDMRWAFSSRCYYRCPERHYDAEPKRSLLHLYAKSRAESCEVERRKKSERTMKFNLDQVIMCQRANGSFNVNVLKDISLSEERTRSLLPPHDGIDEKNAFLIWVTIIVLKHLEIKESSRKSEWKFIAQKSQKWVESRLTAEQFSEWFSIAESLIKSL